MSAFIAYDAQPSTTPYVRPNARYISSHPDEIPYANAIREIRSNMKNASPKRLHIYSFNIRADELESAHASLDKQQGRRLMRVTYNDDYNFVVRYMPNPAHEAAHVSWSAALNLALAQLTTTPHILPPGCRGMGSTTFQLGQRKKEGDSTFRPDDTLPGPSIVLEVGDSESLSQLKIDARLWLEHMPEVRLVILLSIDPPVLPHPTLPRITVQLWRGVPPPFPPHPGTEARQRVGRMVWDADWTQAATPLYILLSDIFRGQVPAVYDGVDRVQLDTVSWRQHIIDSW